MGGSEGLRVEIRRDMKESVREREGERERERESEIRLPKMRSVVQNLNCVPGV